MKRLFSLAIVFVLVIGAFSLGAIGVSADEVSVENWGNVAFERVNDPDKGFNGELAYVMWTQDTPFYQDVVNIDTKLPKIDDFNFICTIDGTAYTCKRVSVYDGTTWGYLRFVLDETEFQLEFGKTYTVAWSVAKKDGSVTYKGHQSVEVRATETTAESEKMTDEEIAAVMALTALNGKIDQSSVTLDETSNEKIFNADNENVTKLFDGKYTSADGTKMGTHNNADVTVSWKYTEAVTLTHYVLVTGNDTEGSSGRNPVTIKLYGSTNGTDWTLIDTVKNSGMEAKNHAPYAFAVDNPGSYTQYRIVMNSRSQLQLDEILTYNDPEWKPSDPGNTPDPDPTPTPDPAPTGDIALALSAVALIAVAATVVIAKKRKIED